MNDDVLLQQFEDLTLPFDDWTHRAHVKVAFLYLKRHPFDEALRRMRTGIQAYNAANEVAEGPHMGYHETLTRAFMHLIDVMISEYGDATTADAFYDDHPELAQKKVLRFFYSRDRIMSADAKARFFPPDLTPLPEKRG